MILVHDCYNCKYFKIPSYEEPCNTCLSKERKVCELWEAKEEEGENKHV